jgi:hypothetical protein
MSAQMAGGLIGALGQMEQIEIDLHGRDALEAVLSLLSGKDPDVVRCNKLNVGALLPRTHTDLFSDVVRVTLDVDGVEPKAREVDDFADRKVTRWRDYLDPVAVFDALGWPSQ